MIKKTLTWFLAFILASSSIISLVGCDKKTDTNKVTVSQKDELAASATVLEYSTGINADGKYDDSLFYSNDFNLFSTGADPSMFYYDGYYYMYTTSGGKPLICYRTKNFATWEYMGVAYDFSTAYKNGETWANSYYWAPEAFEWEGKFYMYVTVSNINCVDFYPEGLEELADYVEELQKEGKTVTASQISTKSKELYGVALTVAEFSVSNVLLVADEPQGPYELWTGNRTIQKYYHGEKVGEPIVETVTAQTTPFFDWANAPAAWAETKYLFEYTEEERAAYESENGVKRIWEANIFANLDGMLMEEENGDLYYYFTKSADSNGSKGGIWGCKMLNPWTPDYSTLTRLTEPRKLTVGGEYTYGDATTEGTMDGGVNEGPYVMKHTSVNNDGVSVKYYLTYSTGKKAVANNYGYNIAVAVSDSPLGPYKKLEEKYGNPIYMISGEYGTLPSGSWTHGSGHGTFCTVGDETFLIAHSSQSNYTTGVDSERMPIIDRLTWSYNEELGYDLPHMNGPSKTTLQYQPETASGYKNIAPQASVTATNVANESTIAYLTDDYRVIHDSEKDKQFRTNIGGTTITLTFDKPMDVRAIMVYNSRDIKFAFSKIDYILFENGSETKVIRDLDYPDSGLTGTVLEASSILPGGSAIAEFDEMKVSKITLKITQKFSVYEDELIDGVEYGPSMYGIAISDIVVLGKDGNSTGIVSTDTVCEENFKGSNMTDKSNVDSTTEERIELDRNLFDVSGNHGSGYDIKYSSNGNIQVGAGINVPFKNNSRTSNGFVASITSSCVGATNRSWNNAGIAVYTGSNGSTNLQYKIFAIGGENEVRIFFVHYGAPWAERSYSLPYEGYAATDNGKAHTLTVIFNDGIFYVGFAKEDSDMRWIIIDKETEYYTTYKSGVPRNADVSNIFTLNDKVIGVATTDKACVFTNISYSCSEFDVAEAISDVSVTLNSCVSSNGKIVLESNEYLVGDVAKIILKSRTGYKLSELQINGNVVDISSLVAVEKEGGITEYVYELSFVKSGNYTVLAKFTEKE